MKTLFALIVLLVATLAGSGSMFAQDSTNEQQLFQAIVDAEPQSMTSGHKAEDLQGQSEYAEFRHQ